MTAGFIYLAADRLAVLSPPEGRISIWPAWLKTKASKRLASIGFLRSQEAFRSSTGVITTGGGGSVLVLVTPTPSALSFSRRTASRLRVPRTSSVCVRSQLTRVIRHRPRPITCSGRISAFGVNGRNPSTTVTLRTLQSSLAVIGGVLPKGVSRDLQISEWQHKLGSSLP